MIIKTIEEDGTISIMATSDKDDKVTVTTTDPGYQATFENGSKIELPCKYNREEKLYEEISELYKENTRLRVIIFYMILSYLLVLGIGIWVGGLRP